ncbi:MAG: SseB family protein [Pirellulaceae bacterium]
MWDKSSDTGCIAPVPFSCLFAMSIEIDAKLVTAITAQDVEKVRDLMMNAEFILIRVSDEEDDDDDENIGALTATVEDMDVLVAFTSEATASHFIEHKSEELFEDGEEIDGFIVDGETLLDYLPEKFGLLINPENDHTAVVEASFADQIRPKKK